MRNALLLLVLLVGCGRVGFDSQLGIGGGDGGTFTGPPISAQIAYLKASNTDPGDYFGAGLALSADGMTLAVGAWHESSAATGIDGNQADNSASTAGAVYVFARSGATWVQQAYLKPSNTNNGDAFGDRLALSADGNTLAVSAPVEASAATGINGNQADNTARNAGAVYVFSRSGTTWMQEAYLKASNTGAGDVFGHALALSGDGNTLAVTAVGEASAATGVGGNQTDNSAGGAGAAYVFTRSGTTWTQQAYVKASNTNQLDNFGYAIALSADGTTLAVGAASEASAGTGVGGNQSDNSALYAGAAYVFVRTGTLWAQQAYIKASYPDRDDFFGASLALSSTGDTLAVSAPGESSSALGVNGDQANNDAYESGAVYVFVRAGASWAQQAYVKASNADQGAGFGASVALSGDGNVLAASATNEFSAATGVGGNQADKTKPGSGATYELGRSGGGWVQLAYVKASNTDAGDIFGASLAISGDAGTLAVSAVGEASGATGVNGDQANNAAASSGAVYVFR